jgi:large subunit ribosomal protein L9
MKLILKEDVKHLGYVGDVVDVKEGYARNCLLPQNLALAPTESNVKAIAEARAKAAELRRLREEERQAAAQRLAGTEITIRAAANADGGLYGSVGPREIAAALRHEGHTIEADQIDLHEPIRHLDNIVVPVRFAADTIVDVKVWVVREAGSDQIDGDESQQQGSETHNDEHDGGAASES